MHIIRYLAVMLTLTPVGLAVAGAVELLEQLRIDHSILAATERDFRERRDRGTLAGAEASDYAAYVARLHRQVIEDCAALYQAQPERPLPADLPCPATLPAVTRAAAIDQEAERTGAEQVVALEAELAAGLGDFDELLLREQERVRAARPRPAEAGGGGGQGGAGEDGAGADGEGSDEAASETAAGTAAGTGGSDRSPSGARGGSGRPHRGRVDEPPPDIPDGSDDDVVARQLREAAEKETDPALKKKLWEEYRKYKQGTH